MFWMVNPADTHEDAIDFLQQADVTTTCLLDTDNVYSSYPRDETSYAPFPLHVLIDREGIIRYLAYQYEPTAARAAIEAVLGE